MRSLPFELVVSVRFLKEGRVQTGLIFLAVSVGVAVVVFLSALITGLQADLIGRTLGSQAHVVVRVSDDVLRVAATKDKTVLATVEKAPQRVRSIPQWQSVRTMLRGLDGVGAVSPTIFGPGFAVRGAAVKSVTVKGIEPESYDAIVGMTEKIRLGRYLVEGNMALMGEGLAESLGVGVGDRFRIEMSDARADSFTVAGIFDFGNQEVNARLVFTSLATAQSLLDLPGGIANLEVRVKEIFQAENLARFIASQTGLNAESWMESNQQLLAGLRAQSSSSVIIQLFISIAVALGISSVLAVSVVQKSKEIGILKAVGTSTRQILWIFLFQGAIVGFVGSCLGSLLGYGLAAMFRASALNPDGTPRFPLSLDPVLFTTAIAGATLVGLLAAVLPARRAAKLDPAVVIRGG